MSREPIDRVLCCKCGIAMEPNAANMCINCLSSQVDITEGLQKQLTIMHCPECVSYLQPPRTWLKAQPESKELLTCCIKRLNNLNKVRLVHAEFVWTEPHSKRIKVKLKVEKEVLPGALLEQSYVAEYLVHDHLCDSCSRVAANPHQWVAVVQLRQHVPHRRTFFFLEQLILKHGAAANAIRIKQMDQGIDLFFSNRGHGVKFVEFIGKVAPIQDRHDKQLVSHDAKSNTHNYKYTFSVEISPICREDLICLPPKVAVSLGNLGPIVICSKVTNAIALLDPLTLRHCILDADRYWRTSFRSLLTSRQLVEYIVLDIENICTQVNTEVNIGGSKYILADAQVARVSDLGRNGTIVSIRTHLGHILNPGDYALGYDLYGANSNDMELDQYEGLQIPEVILMKKSYEEKRQRKREKPRSWKLKSLEMDLDDKDNNREEQDERRLEYEQFLRDLEENPDMRLNISLYRNKEYQPSEMIDGEDGTSVALDELLVDLDINRDDGDNGMHEQVAGNVESRI